MTRNPIDIATEHAVRAWARRNSGTWSDIDEAELQAWLTTDPQNRAAYDKVARLWSTAGDLEGRVAFVAAVPHRLGARRALARLAVAAIAVAVIVPVWRLGTNSWNGVPVLLRADHGSPKAFVLRDGTGVLLDADSELVAQLGARLRRVILRRGEALFTVVHDAAKPFEVDVGNGRIMDLGTRFDVENLQGAARIAVLEGRVSVATPHGQVSLVAGRSGGYDGDGMLLPVKPLDKSVGLWQHGQRHFEGEPFAYVRSEERRVGKEC